MQQVDKSMHLEAAEICEGEAPVFVFNFPQNENGQGKTDVKIQMETYPGSDEWESFDDLTYYDAGPKVFTYEDKILEVGVYSFRVKIGSGGFDYKATLDVVECADCEESFSYTDNNDGTYTFIYVPAEDMEEAEVVFTFPQSVVVSGYVWDNWNGNSSSRTEIMDLKACEIYTWTVGLDGDCRGVGQKGVNLFTDFKVNDISRKNGVSILKAGC